ncbi:MAG TPA: AMP-binding protein [Acidimicrobiales bacterium]|nr:AMP-binding protein [Acidimicrobiales bacterium]
MNLGLIIEPHPDGAPALVSRGAVTTYGDLRRQVAEVRGGLTRLGVKPGDRVALALPNNWFFVVSYLAALGVGAVAVPLNPTSPSAEMFAELASVRATVLIAGAAAASGVNGVDRAALGIEHFFAPEGSELAGAEAFESLVGGETAPVVDRTPDDLAVLIFTAGTGGSPKAAMLTHSNLLSNIEQAQSQVGQEVLAEDVALGVLPMFHIFGLNVVLGIALYAGASVVLVERFDPASAVETIRDRGVTVLAGAPTMYAAIMALPRAEAGDLSTVRLALTGAAPMPPDVATGFAQRFNIPLRQGYGLTEASPVVTSSALDGEPRPYSIGQVLPGVEVRLVDEEGEDALEGDAGEIWVRGANVFPGYWEDADATAAAKTPEGWLRTGDVAVTDDEGYLYLIDRAKDLIIVSGFNVYPAEVEDAIAAHAGVADVAVVGVAHPHSGEAVKAFVAPKPGIHLEEDQLIEFVGKRLARYKCPTKVTFVEELPHGLGGKLLRRALR